MVQEPGLSHVQELGIKSLVVEVEVAVVGSEQLFVLVGQVEVGYFLQGNQDGVPFPHLFQNLILRRNFSLYFFLEFFYLSGFGKDVTPNEALPHIGRQPRRNAKDDRCNLPALL